MCLYQQNNLYTFFPKFLFFGFSCFLCVNDDNNDSLLKWPCDQKINSYFSLDFKNLLPKHYVTKLTLFQLATSRTLHFTYVFLPIVLN